MSPVLSAEADVGVLDVVAEMDAHLERTLRLQRRGRHGVHCGAPQPAWNVRLITSICCSRVSRMKLTA
jgi:hypothetical protein